MTSGGAHPLRPCRRFGSLGRTGRALLYVGALAGGALAAQAGTVQVEVADATGKPLAVAGRMGCVAAAEVISHYGARPETDLKALFRAQGLL